MGDLFDLFRKRQKKDKILSLILKKIGRIESQLSTENKENNVLEQEPQTEDKTPEQSYILIKEPESKEIVRDELLEEVQRNKKDIVKIKILEESKDGRLTPQELKKIIVDKHRYCSKATFYRYISELKRTKKLASMEVNNKEVLYNSSFE